MGKIVKILSWHPFLLWLTRIVSPLVCATRTPLMEKARESPPSPLVTAISKSRMVVGIRGLMVDTSIPAAH